MSKRRRPRVNSAMRQRKLSQSGQQQRNMRTSASKQKVSTQKGQNSPRQQNRRPQRSGPSGEPLKFEGEFDFESANARFEEIEKEFTEKLKIGSNGKHQSNQSGNDTSLTTSQSMPLQDLQDQQHLMMKQKSMTSGIESEQKPESHMTAEEQKNFYDKNMSFFDRISCESSDKNQTKPKDWKQEKKINAETFGFQQRQLMQDKYNSYNRQGGYNNRPQQNRNYPRNNNSNNQQQQSRPSNNQQRYGNQNNQRMTTVGNGNQSRGYNNRRNDMDESYGQERSQRRFGSR
jgi:hypothetical protein